MLAADNIIFISVYAGSSVGYNNSATVAYACL